jgi:hypothetical protein
MGVSNPGKEYLKINGTIQSEGAAEILLSY